ncbi:MAG: HD domain-containing protein [Candidatus Peregrinibacteria bacterium]|nr:HD domain-containing protein [Candidatus Peregrinibacteria bacterium]
MDIHDEQLEQWEREVLVDIERDAAELSYHNDQHTREVIARVKNLASHSKLSPQQQKLLVLAALFHDYGHAGQTIRQTSPKKDIHGEDLSNEEFAARKAREKLGASLSVGQIIRLQEMILRTSFGQNVQGSPHYRDYAPKEDQDTLLALADVGAFMEKSFEQWVEESLRVLVESAALPQDFAAWKKNRTGFLGGYVRSKLEAVKHQLDEKYYQELAEKLNAMIQKIDTELESTVVNLGGSVVGGLLHYE